MSTAAEAHDPPLRDVTFHNVTIRVSAADAPSAYAALCTALGTLDTEWITDTYTIHDEDGGQIEEGTTDALWPPAE